MLLMPLLFSCSDDDVFHSDQLEKTIEVNFEEEKKIVSKSSGSFTVNIVLNQPVTLDGSVRVRLSGSAVKLADYQTFPASEDNLINLPVVKGKSKVSIEIMQLSDNRSAGTKTLKLSLEAPSQELRLGTKRELQISLLEETIPHIEFTEASGQVSEDNEQGIAINLSLTGTVLHQEIVYVKIDAPDGFAYGTDFITEPAPHDENGVRFQVAPDTETQSINIVPINNHVLKGDFELLLSIGVTSDGLGQGTRSSFVLTIKEDDIINASDLHSISELRRKFEQHEGEWYLPQDYYIEGTVTSSTNVMDEKTIYIQDNTGGIMLVFNNNRLVSKGDKVQINLINGEGKLIDGQKAITGINGRVGITLGENVTVTPKRISLQELQSGEYDCQRVLIEDVVFPDSDGKSVWLGEHQMSDGTHYGKVKVYASEAYSNEVLPSESSSIIGVVGSWKSVQPQDYLTDIPK